MADRKNYLAPVSVNEMTRPYFGNPNIAAQGAKARAARGGYATPEQAKDVAETALGFTPVIGDLLSGYDAVQAARQGNYGEAALNAVGLLPFVPSMAGIFVGKGSKTWNKAMNDLAQDLEKRGVSPKKIWETTGNFKSPDGKWRQEIDDSASRFVENKAATEFMSGTGPAEYPVGAVSNVLNHPQLSAAYPDAMAIKARLKKGQSGAYIPNTGFGEALDLPSSGAHSTSLHELQHAIQQREGWSAGGSPAKDSMDTYRRLAGEAEARATQARMAMSQAQRRKVFPLDSYDVPINQLILKK